ncbi:MAG: [protein-PII] uridylyltransferase [Gammaproteobacteria bacterium]|nr:MAG: [protein-PII] uridylyltransferase [Gammaproteobacteria bacterium]
MISAELDAILVELDGHRDVRPPPLKPWKEAHARATEHLYSAFRDGVDVVELVHARAAFIDALLARAWRLHLPPDAAAALVAVGGYGRGELHPHSDVDVLILTTNDPQTLAEHIEPLVMFLWDIGLEIGHSTRSLTQCVAAARDDVTIATNLMESRHLAGEERLFREMLALTGPHHLWPSDAFFRAKLAEQRARHAAADESGQDLEPNIKNNPGGLRDIQMIGWVAKRHFGATRLSHLKTHGFLTEEEYQALKAGEHLLWEIRFALHMITDRHEDRLLFEHQRRLAELFGYGSDNPAVERFMQSYYRTVIELQRLNEMLLQLFHEAILLKNELGEPVRINRRFQARGNYLEVSNPAIFARSPLAMLELFLILQQHPQLEGVRANTIRAVRAHRHLIDARLRADIRARSLFMEILRQPAGVTHALRRMHRYGVLSRYLPAFRTITGLMQFDLFHLYTVDEHTLMVVRNVRRFTLSEHAGECRLCHELVTQIPKLELLYLAALFHDIAKGRGGDHSELGVVDARGFCVDHGLSPYDTELVAWLVRQHLLMSYTAQRKDIDDPAVITDFAARVGTIERLSYLYLLTVADMRGTNPELWNAWKSALLSRLYHRTREVLASGLDNPEDENARIQAVQDAARQLLESEGHADEAIRLCWINFSTEYFLQTPPEAVAWHTRLMLAAPDTRHRTQVHLRDDPERGCTEIFTLGPDRDDLFADTTALLDRLGLDILGARIDTTTEGLSINSYFVLEADGTPLTPERAHEVQLLLEKHLDEPAAKGRGIPGRLPRRLRAFDRETGIDFQQDQERRLTIMHLSTHDRPGLLSMVGAVLAEQGLRLHSARVSTEGEVARDWFTLSDRNDRPITDPQRLDRLREQLEIQLTAER